MIGAGRGAWGRVVIDVALGIQSRDLAQIEIGWISSP
jgi:hypothetical protein